MKKIFVLLISILTISINVALCQDTIKNKLAWWQEAKFGLFLHWGLYSATSLEWNGHPAKGNEHMMWGEKITLR
jgi:alpha-L-fucosidase